MEHKRALEQALSRVSEVLVNPERSLMIAHSVKNKEALVSANGALATWTPPESTGRSPKDTYIVEHPETRDTVDWDSPYCIGMSPETFDMLWQDALEVVSEKPRVYITDRALGADPSYSLPVRTITDRALTALFTDNMFRPVPQGIEKSVFADKPFVLIALPYDKVKAEKYAGRLRQMPDGSTSNMVVAMDFDRRMGLVYGSAYGGSVKKLMFTVMNYLLPGAGILPLHCSANEGKNGDTAMLLGLSGTGKTTLSADPERALLGDDEHGWGDDGIANFENGCYAKLINLRKDKEPEIWNAVFHRAPYLEHGAIVENAMMYPDGSFDLDDDRLTPNSRASYPLSFLNNIKTPPVAGHPKTILFLTADANGVLPPVARLNEQQAMLWFLMGYTSKLAGTETGIVDPVSTFSRFFGEPFMPRNPDVYATMLGQKMRKHNTRVYLINTGWTAGPFGVGHRMDITLTRRIVSAALSGELDGVEYKEDPLFHLQIPTSCPGVPGDVLFPRNTWPDPHEYDKRAEKLARDFARHFDKTYASKVSQDIAKQCPGK